MVTQEDFTVYDPSETKNLDEFKSASQIPDALWVDRTRNLPVGSSFTANRPDSESVRAFKRKINRAAMVHFKSLEWKSRDLNLTGDNEPIHFIVKIKAQDVTAYNNALKAKQQQATQEVQQPIEVNSSITNTSETEPAPVGSGRRSARG